MELSTLNLPRTTEEQRLVQDNCIFLARVGSTMYGTNLANSDDDMVGVFIEDIDYVVGRKAVETVEFKTNASSSGKRNQAGDKDYNFHSLDKWIGLALNNNPNILELFFTPKNCILHETEEWVKLRENKELFISLKSFHSFSGYAHAQMHRLGVKSGNNTGRKDLIEKFGYDCKMASHNIRLYCECRQLLKEGQITMPLPDRQMVLQVKRGEWTKEDFIKKAEELGKQCETIYGESKLRYSPDFEAVSKLQKEIFLNFWKRTGQL